MVNIFRNLFGNKSTGSGNARQGSTSKFNSDAFQSKIKDGISKEVQGYLASKKLCGNLKGQQREISDNAKKMLEILAERQVKKEVKNQEKKEAAEAKKAKDAADKKQKSLRQSNTVKEEPSPFKNYFFGSTEDPV